ncbi:4710_t:CDS:2 [Funneliformis mosseae]|uniref:4710_t:CDS:1 n=1 Tax=Funneliformis mosseae TaxID=27381 RepID=A0A9N9GAE4_FUNMO|nr:4710_t:CDS:2 [Funneliformis mosseae]
MNSELLENEIYYNENDELCLNCGNLYSHVEADEFKNIHDFIKSQQQKARSPYEFFEWIPYEKFEEVTQIGKGGFATIYSATGIKGILRHYNEEDNGFFRYDAAVALKRLHDSNDSFLNEVGYYPVKFKDKGVLRCFGISQNPQTKEYVMFLN